eukprot:Anaeramoba_ignava/c17271_g1_i2.p1 GENE.c17271_g1_i2~~c17271_g1_i2.p1  ORF type:complete len:128 (+),score=56.03 c17271_g1_i2:53-436(+)
MTENKADPKLQEQIKQFKANQLKHAKTKETNQPINEIKLKEDIKKFDATHLKHAEVQEKKPISLKTIFDGIDKNKNGFLEFSEIKLYANDLFGKEATDEEAKQLFDEMDGNKDGKITFEEFKNWMEK